MPRRRPFINLLRALIPVFTLLVLAAISVAIGLTYAVTHPLRNEYLVTPDRLREFDARALKTSNETWMNRDKTQAVGWVLRGDAGAPAVILLHRYGADRSWLLNLGVKINALTGYTILWTDFRGHGQSPVKWTAFGTREADDVLSAMDFLRAMKMPGGQSQVGGKLGIYGVEMGAFAALKAASVENSVTALALDSVPAAPDSVMNQAVNDRMRVHSAVLQTLTRTGARLYLWGEFTDTPACRFAEKLSRREVLLLAGADVPELQTSTVALQQCLAPNNHVEAQTQLSMTGFNLPYAPAEQSELYDRRIVDFFSNSLSKIENSNQQMITK